MPQNLLLRRLPLLALLLMAGLLAFFGREKISLGTLAEHFQAVTAFRDSHFAWAAGLFVVAYVAMVAFSLPGAIVATLTGGVLFGVFPGVVFNVLGATLGSMLIFGAARMGFGGALAEKMRAKGGKVARVEAALRENEWSVLFLMRLLPVVPFFLANLLPAVMGVSMRRFAVSTALGILPGALVYTGIGAGLAEVLARGEAPTLASLKTPGVVLPLVGLAVLAALPMVLRLWRGRVL
ncbi:TVP38/TMEM64 family protein [Neogemmobacter tilapiae]|uniref:TVP38/TMEM64 family membrane protein n=1 Tax=Neogemmobacter tilapiae TaxID=875041 RepID=A0A918TU51_9RHOB|nr:TVP38/TMEM64 family protein [Gemmobacter tilapiae]GHC63475.1 TVP38/TMEM64 family protein [Gemmobacter tilapiae]